MEYLKECFSIWWKWFVAHCIITIAAFVLVVILGSCSALLGA
jgi:hypothetical protein